MTTGIAIAVLATLAITVAVMLGIVQYRYDMLRDHHDDLHRAIEVARIGSKINQHTLHKLTRMLNEANDTIAQLTNNPDIAKPFELKLLEFDESGKIESTVEDAFDWSKPGNFQETD